jgi:hypothetical protein
MKHCGETCEVRAFRSGLKTAGIVPAISLMAGIEIITS